MEFEVTHPFHPWRGRRFVAATRKHNWGEERVMYFDDEGRLRSLLLSWTDLHQSDVRIEVAAGRACLRADDLSILAAVVDELKSRGASRRRGVK